MSLQKFLKFIIICVAIVCLFYSGYLFGVREKFNSQADITDVIATNGARKNYLTQIERRFVFGAISGANNQAPGNFGELLFIQEENNQTQLLFTLQNVPSTVKSLDNKNEKIIPGELNILLATKTTDGTDFNYESIGKLIFDAPDKANLRTTKFSTTINKTLYNSTNPAESVQRIELRPFKQEDENIFTLDNADLPIQVRNRKAPFFWVNL